MALAFSSNDLIFKSSLSVEVTKSAFKPSDILSAFRQDSTSVRLSALISEPSTKYSIPASCRESIRFSLESFVISCAFFSPQRSCLPMACANLCKPCRNLLLSKFFLCNTFCLFPNLCKPCKDLQGTEWPCIFAEKAL